MKLHVLALPSCAALVASARVATAGGLALPSDGEIRQKLVAFVDGARGAPGVVVGVSSRVGGES